MRCSGGTFTPTKVMESSPKKQHQQQQQQLLSNGHLMLYLGLWYFFSGTTLFLNKYVITYLDGDALFLGVVQLATCSWSSYLQLRYGPIVSHRFRLWWSREQHHKAPSLPVIHLQTLFVNFFKFSVIGFLRFFTVVSSLIALWYIPVSFAELIKSSAPLFTVIISVLVLQESTSCRVLFSLLPIMIGLGLCSAYEIHFHYLGFAASMLSNLSECFQNVLSKRVLTLDKYSPSQIQFFTSVYSVLVQVPYVYYFLYTRLDSLNDLWSIPGHTIFIFLLSGFSFHLQSMSEYALLTIISPVTHSVANAVKRATLIWLSVLVFGNPVTLMSWFGTFLVISGIFFYNHAKNLDTRQQPDNWSEQLLPPSLGQQHDNVDHVI